jgi:DnaJ-class molecular chaperone
MMPNTTAWEYESESVCPVCSGSGEGLYDGESCYLCNGTGADLGDGFDEGYWEEDDPDER